MLCSVFSLWLSLQLLPPQQAPWLYKCLSLSSVPLFICYSLGAPTACSAVEPACSVRWLCIPFWLGFFVFLGKMKWKITFMWWFSLLVDRGLILHRPHVWALWLFNPWFPGCTCLQIVGTVTKANLPTWNTSFMVMLCGPWSPVFRVSLPPASSTSPAQSFCHTRFNKTISASLFPIINVA